MPGECGVVEVRVARGVHPVLADPHRGLHDQLAAGVTAVGVAVERLLRVVRRGEALGEDDAVLDGLGGALAQVRGDRVDRVADCGRPPGCGSPA
jgi:hypothetical protein